MSIQGKHWYRFEFLKSDEWRDFRLQVLADCKGTCFICGVQDASNDVHHVWYGEPSYTGVRQFVVLCRGCHDAIHSVLVPSKATKESERMEAWNHFYALAKLINARHRTLAKKKAKALKCRACWSEKTTIIVDPIRHLVFYEQCKGRIRLCPSCFEDLKKEFPARIHGTKKLWNSILAFLDARRPNNLSFDSNSFVL